MKLAGGSIAVLLLYSVGLVVLGCSGRQYSISPDIISDSLVDDWYERRPEIAYLAMRGDKQLVDKLFLLIPAVTKTDCTCMAGSPGDVAAIIVTREYELDPDLKILGEMSPDDRRWAFRYLCAVQPIDWEPDRIKNLYAIATE